MSTSNIVEVVDDTDPRVNYFGSWKSGGRPGELNETTHGTYKEGSQVHFTFTGNCVAVYGTIPQMMSKHPRPAPKSQYSIDGSSSESFSPPLSKTVLHRQLFYQSPMLPTSPRQHTLTITSLVDGGELWLDYFQVGVDQSPTEAPISKGVIAGAVVGSIVIVILTGIAVWLYFRNKARRNALYNENYVSAYGYGKAWKQ